VNLTIKQFADQARVGVETVRFYQRKGLLETPSRDTPIGGIRRYGDRDVQRLRFIRQAQRAGFTLEEIRELIALDSGHDHRRAREMATKRLIALDDQIAELDRARTALRHLANLCATQTSGPCPILIAFEPR
jgi:MerR family mercuric resistance operon transcriptional regulator